MLKSSYRSKWCSPRWWINVILAGSKVAQIRSIQDSRWFNVSALTTTQMLLIILVPVVSLSLYTINWRMRFGSSVNYDLFCDQWLVRNSSFLWFRYRNHIGYILPTGFERWLGSSGSTWPKRRKGIVFTQKSVGFS